MITDGTVSPKDAIIGTPSESIQSSILKPHYTDSDIKYATPDMFGVGPHSLMKHNFGSMNVMFRGSNWEVMMIQLKTNILARLRVVFSALIELESWYQSLRLVIVVQFWWFIALLNIFPETITTTETNFSSSISDDIQTDPFHRYLSFISNLPTRVGNHALRSSLANSIPKNKQTIRYAVGRNPIPKHLVAIYDMIPLVVPPPPEIPIPYLTAEKRLVVPEKKETSRVLSQRAEWSAAHHTQKASEIIRICSEVSRLITWTAYGGIKNLTIYEGTGHAWNDLKRLSCMIKSEMSTLNNGMSDHTLSIKIINLALDKSVVIGDELCDSSGHIGLNSALKTVEPIPSSANINSCGTLSDVQEEEEEEEDDDEGGDGSPIAYNDLTVLLVSKHDGLASIAATVRDTLRNPANSVMLPDITEEVDKQLEKHGSPDLIISFTNKRQHPSVLHGLPLFNLENQPLFLSDTTQTSFPFFVKAMTAFSKEEKKTGQ